MAVTPTEAREFNREQFLYLHDIETRIDTFIRYTGLGSGTTITYEILGQDKQNLNSKAQTELIKRYNDVGWNASFTMAGPNPKDFVLVDPNG